MVHSTEKDTEAKKSEFTCQVTQLEEQKSRCEVGSLPSSRVCVLKSCAIPLLSEKKEIEGRGGRRRQQRRGKKKEIEKKRK